MIISCPSCETTYDLPETTIGASGRKVKCATCGTKWQVSPASTLLGDGSQPASAQKEKSRDDWDMTEETATSAIVTNPQAIELDRLTKDGLALEEAETSLETVDGNVDVEIDTSSKATARSLPINPVNPLLRTADQRSLSSKLHESREEDHRAAFRAKVLRPTAFVATLLLFALFIILREPISRQFPDLASLYQLAGFDVNLTGFTINNVRSERVIESGGPVLIVTGEIENVTNDIAEAPKLRFGLQTNTDEEIYAWEHEISIPTLVPGGVARFQSRLSAPPNLGRNMTVRFADKNSG